MLCLAQTKLYVLFRGAKQLYMEPGCDAAEYTCVFATPTHCSKACEVIESTPPMCVKHLEQQ